MDIVITVLVAAVLCVSRATLRHAAVDASRLGQAGTILAPAITDADLTCFVDRPTRANRQLTKT